MRKFIFHLNACVINSFMLGFWAMAWIITFMGIVEFTWILFFFVFNLIALIMSYMEISHNRRGAK